MFLGHLMSGHDFGEGSKSTAVEKAEPGLETIKDSSMRQNGLLVEFITLPYRKSATSSPPNANPRNQYKFDSINRLWMILSILPSDLSKSVTKPKLQDDK